MTTLQHHIPIRRLLAAAATVVALAVVAPGAALAASGGDNNRGDTWVDTVGEPPGPGHEMDPHLPCANINLWGDKMADPSGSYKIYGWEPSGKKELAYSSNWSYNQNAGGSQVMDVIDVQQLIANAVANGDAPVNSQGFHFKIALSQDPHKYKTFWVKCGIPPTPPVEGPPPVTSVPPAITPPAPGANAPAASTPQQQVLGERISGGKKPAKRHHKARKHTKKHRKHHKVATHKLLPAFTG
jgi:hypothetical protein